MCEIFAKQYGYGAQLKKRLQKKSISCHQNLFMQNHPETRLNSAYLD